MSKQYLKMADVFVERLVVREKSPRLLDCCGVLAANFLNELGAKYAAHAINSHDELVRQRDELLDAMRQTLAMLRVTSHGPSAANKAEEMLHAAICSLGAGHSPDAGKMVPDGWQLVPLDPTIEMISAATRDSVGFGSRAAYQAMLAAAPKLGGGELWS